MNTMEAIARILKEEGVEWIACFPSNNLIEEVAKVGIRTIMFPTGNAARSWRRDGYSRLNDRKQVRRRHHTGRPPAQKNSMGGLAQAFADNIPMLYLPGGSTVAQMQVRPNFSPARTYEAVSKYSEVILQPDMVSSTMRRAFHHLRNGRGGPVVVELPGDVGTMEVSESAMNYQPPQAPPAAALRWRHQGTP